MPGEDLHDAPYVATLHTFWDLGKSLLYVSCGIQIVLAAGGVICVICCGMGSVESSPCTHALSHASTVQWDSSTVRQDASTVRGGFLYSAVGCLYSAEGGL